MSIPQGILMLACMQDLPRTGEARRTRTLTIQLVRLARQDKATRQRRRQACGAPTPTVPTPTVPTPTLFPLALSPSLSPLTTSAMPRGSLQRLHEAELDNTQLLDWSLVLLVTATCVAAQHTHARAPMHRDALAHTCVHNTLTRTSRYTHTCTRTHAHTHTHTDARHDTP
jgi:hypothetical protein